MNNQPHECEYCGEVIRGDDNECEFCQSSIKPSNEPLEQCGFCGRYFRNEDFCDDAELKQLSKKQLDDAPLGYCPDAQIEDCEQNPWKHYQITHDMAIDACDPSLEGQWI